MGWFRADDDPQQRMLAVLDYVHGLEAQVGTLQRRLDKRSREAAALEAELHRERARREAAERALPEFMGQLVIEQRARVQLEARVAELDDERQALELRVDDANAGEGLDADVDASDDEATRRRVLRMQALRARLAKTDMSPRARLRTLRHAYEAGIKLTRAQCEELDELLDSSDDSE